MKTMLITGSTDGIGKLAAIMLAKKGHTIYLHARNQEKLDVVINAVKTLAENENIYGFVSDFNDLESVKNMANKILDEGSVLDVIINNAGVFKSALSTNKDGIDTRYVVNYLAPYLLSRSLMPLIEKSTAPRVINLSSAAQASIDIDALEGKKELSAQEAYAQSKLALTMWSFDLAKKFKSINVIAVNPGSLLNTKMATEAYGKYWSSAEKGAQIIYDLATAEEYQNSSGKYFDNDHGIFSDAHPDAYNQEKINQLISVTDAILLNK